MIRRTSPPLVDIEVVHHHLPRGQRRQVGVPQPGDERLAVHCPLLHHRCIQPREHQGHDRGGVARVVARHMPIRPLAARARAYSGVIRVCVPVSSTNTSRSAATSAIASRHASRATSVLLAGDQRLFLPSSPRAAGRDTSCSRSPRARAPAASGHNVLRASHRDGPAVARARLARDPAGSRARGRWSSPAGAGKYRTVRSPTEKRRAASARLMPPSTARTIRSRKS